MEIDSHLETIYYLLDIHGVDLTKPIDRKACLKVNYILDIIEGIYHPLKHKETFTSQCHLCSQPVERLSRGRMFTCIRCKAKRISTAERLRRKRAS